jgi:AcrR family transcriptional regulator
VSATVLSLPPRDRRPDDVVARILAGALTAASKGGVRRLSMGEVAAAAGVSRRTLYRYFSSRAALLECMNDKVRRRWEAAVEESLRHEQEPTRQVRQVLASFSGTLVELPGHQTLFARDPGYVMVYLHEHMDFFVDTVVRLVGRVLGAAEAVRSGPLTVREAAELLVRIGMSDFLVHDVVSDPAEERLEQRLAAFWSMVGDLDREMYASVSLAWAPAAGPHLAES